MAYTIVIGGVVRHITYYTVPGQVATNKRDWQCVSMTGGSSMGSTGILAELDNLMATGVKPCMSQDSRYYGSQLYYQTPTPPFPRPDSTVANSGPGLAGTGLIPTQSCGLISLYTNDLGPTGQGRIYVPFPCPDDLEANGTPVNAYLVNLEVLGLLLVAPLTIVSGGVTGIFNPVLYKPGGAPPKQITKFLRRDAFATQRRRGAFGKVNANPF